MLTTMGIVEVFHGKTDRLSGKGIHFPTAPFMTIRYIPIMELNSDIISEILIC